MKIRIQLIAAFFLLICIAGLFIIYFLMEKHGNLFLLLPNSLRSPGIEINKIEEFSKNEFLLTYEITSPERVGTGEYPVTLTWTDSSYPHIFGLPILEGSFFSKQAWTGKLRHAVLNEKAAFTLFGSNRIVNNRFRIRNDTWLVTGVISDRDDDTERIYVPSSVRGGEATALALTISGKFDETYIKNSLKDLGIWEDSFDFINFAVFRRLFWERAWTISVLFLIFLLFNMLRPLINALKGAITVLRTKLEQNYLAEMLKKQQKTIFKFIFLVLALVFSPVLAIFLLIRLISVWLPWQDIPSLSGLNQDSFYSQLDKLINLETVSFSLFVLSLAVLVIFFISLNVKEKESSNITNLMKRHNRSLHSLFIKK